MSAPRGFVREYVNDDCHCTATAVYMWRPSGPDGSFTAILKRLEFTRSLFCGSDHERELRSWLMLIGEPAPPILSNELLFHAKGNSETPAG